MESLAQLQKSVMQDIVDMMDDREKLMCLKEYIGKLNSNDFEDDSEVMTEEEQQQLLDNIRQGLREVKLEREGKLKLKDARDLINELPD